MIYWQTSNPWNSTDSIEETYFNDNSTLVLLSQCSFFFIHLVLRLIISLLLFCSASYPYSLALVHYCRCAPPPATNGINPMIRGQWTHRRRKSAPKEVKCRSRCQAYKEMDLCICTMCEIGRAHKRK